MYIKDLIRNGLTIPENTLYNSEPWFIYSRTWILPILQRYYGNHEILDIIADDAATMPDIIADVKATMVTLFAMNNWKYKHLYNLYAAEYNPIWNVDGTETTITHRETSGTLDKTDGKSGDDSLEYLGEDKLTKGGKDTLTISGSEELSKQGTVTAQNSGDVQQARTTFDSDTDYDTNKTTDSTKTETKFGKTALGTADPYKETTTYTSRTNETGYNSTDTRSFTGRKDKTTYNSTNTIDEDTTGMYDETITHKRGGNIGLTMTQQMGLAEIDFVGKFKFLDTIAHDIASTITYM